MRLIRYRKADGLPTYGWILSQAGETMVGPVEGSPYGDYRRMEAELPLSSVRLLLPVQPSKIICVGLNYAIHAKEIGAAIPEVPLLFLKPPSTLVGPEDEIKLPPQSRQVEHEAELVAVIRSRGRWIPPEEAQSYILGFTVGNDVTARDLQQRDGQWTRSKGFDTFCPIGPWIETEFDPADQVITCHVNGEMRQMSSTRDMIFNLRQLIAFISSIMTFEAGDIIMTGTPAGVGPLQPGDRVEVSIEGIGTLSNPVVSEHVS